MNGLKYVECLIMNYYLSTGGIVLQFVQKVNLGSWDHGSPEG